MGDGRPDHGNHDAEVEYQQLSDADIIIAPDVRIHLSTDFRLESLIECGRKATIETSAFQALYEERRAILAGLSISTVT
jgi:hypothetical protein